MTTITLNHSSSATNSYLNQIKSSESTLKSIAAKISLLVFPIIAMFTALIDLFTSSSTTDLILSRTNEDRPRIEGQPVEISFKDGIKVVLENQGLNTSQKLISLFDITRFTSIDQLIATGIESVEDQDLLELVKNLFSECAGNQAAIQAALLGHVMRTYPQAVAMLAFAQNA